MGGLYLINENSLKEESILWEKPFPERPTAGFEEIGCHAVNEDMEKTLWQGVLAGRGCFKSWDRPSVRSWGAQSCNIKKIHFYQWPEWTWKWILPIQASKWEHSPANILISAQGDLGERTQLSHAWILAHRNCSW
jgi:hypothetical protein